MKAGYICQISKADRMFEVRERAKDEDLQNYVHHVARMSGEHHRAEFPHCTCKHLDIKLPVTSNGIGFPGDALTPAEMEGLKWELHG